MNEWGDVRGEGDMGLDMIDDDICSDGIGYMHACTFGRDR